MLGYTLIRKSELAYLKRSSAMVQTLINCHRWFSGWKDLDIIWDYIFSETYFGGIETARKKYADARGTDVYGDSINKKEE